MTNPIEELLVYLEQLDDLSPSARQEVASVLRGWVDAQAVRQPAVAGEIPMQFDIVGESPVMQEVFSLLAKLSRADIPVLVLGESGTGKELIASALHKYGPRRKKKLVAVNCAAIPANLLEAEIFGHMKGSFTGAHKDRIGYAQAADGGVLFLDEIGEIAFDLQAKLLRFLQDGEVRPVGSNITKKVNVRVVAATNQDILAQVQAGKFREDLYYRLAVFTLPLPPLRERKQDIPHLAQYFLDKQQEASMPSAEISEEALEVLMAGQWPGNIRQLQNELLRASTFASAGKIEASDLSENL
ncbi:MAG: sigma-54 dependent transcriptional regulator [Planctomycetota bacterium]|jgi:DNA-binding NtrC family response regulator|nr:sigma-54 dependent transcriptional regulator [Planctomycetota bacterium]